MAIGQSSFGSFFFQLPQALRRLDASVDGARPVLQPRWDPEAQIAAAPVVQFEKLGKVFDGPSGEIVALHDVDLTIGRGEIFGIIGRSGAGKSTLLRCINRLEQPSRGRVLVGGQEVGAVPAAQLAGFRRRIGMIFQHFNLLSSRTVFDNVALPLKLAGASRGDMVRTVFPLLDLVGLSDKRDVYPAKLSGGQKQRVGIARALVHNPEILLCDEATSALDPETTLSILGLLKDINERLGLTIVLITHEMSVIREICDHVAVLDRSRVVETGPVWDLFAEPRAEVTRSFLRALSPDLPDVIRDRVSPEPIANGSLLLRIRFSGPAAHRQIVSSLALSFDLAVGILHGGIDYIQGLPIGNLVLSVPSPDPQMLQGILQHVEQRGAHAEVIGYVARAH